MTITENPSIYSSKAFRLLDRQHNLGSTALRHYANRMVLMEYTEVKARNTLYDMKNAFYDRFCINSWILFGDEGSENKKTHIEYDQDPL